MDRIIIMTGVYDTLDIFAYELIKEYKNMGLEVFEFNVSDMGKALSELAKFIQQPVKAVVTFNNLGFNMELVEGKNMWEQLGIPVINILMDHPFAHKNALDNAGSTSIVLCPDRNHMNYVKRFYPEISIVGFLPHGGREGDKALLSEGKRYKPLCERNIDVLYAGGISYKFVEQSKPDFSQFSFDAEAVANEAFSILIDNPWKTTEDVIEECLLKRDIHLEEKELCDVIEKLHYVDMLAVSHYREKVVKTLVEAGVKVTLYGTGWEILDWIDNPNLDYRGRVSAYEIVDLMYDAKIVLNTMTWFKDGTHDRVFNGMLAGAVAVTDSSIYMKEEFDETNLVLFELNEIDLLPEKVKSILENNPQEIADSGYQIAFEKHTWIYRAHELYEDLISQL